MRKLAKSQACIIDAGGRDKLETGHLVDVVNIPLDELRRQLPEIPRDRPAYLHCRTN